MCMYVYIDVCMYVLPGRGSPLLYGGAHGGFYPAGYRDSHHHHPGPGLQRTIQAR